MPPEGALLESRTLRVELLGRVDVLDKIKALVMLPDGIHVRTEDVSRYFEVSTGVIRQLTVRHRAELAENGMRVLRGSDLRRFHSDMVSLCSADGRESYPQAVTQLTLYTRRAVLNIAMLLRDSDIARCVRTYLLDAEDELRKGYADLDRRVTIVESCLGGVGIALQELGPVLHRMSSPARQPGPAARRHQQGGRCHGQPALRDVGRHQPSGRQGGRCRASAEGSAPRP